VESGGKRPGPAVLLLDLILSEWRVLYVTVIDIRDCWRCRQHPWHWCIDGRTGTSTQLYIRWVRNARNGLFWVRYSHLSYLLRYSSSVVTCDTTPSGHLY